MVCQAQGGMALGPISIFRMVAAGTRVLVWLDCRVKRTYGIAPGAWGP